MTKPKCTVEEVRKFYKVKWIQLAPEYRVWESMKWRCLKPRSKYFHNYGGRGIKVCPEWAGKRSFKNFIADMGMRPTPQHTLERIDNDGPYSSTNCRWATRTEQMRNMRRNRLFTINGETKPLAVWIEQSGLNKKFVSHRIEKGWDIERALYAPKQQPNFITDAEKNRIMELYRSGVGITAIARTMGRVHAAIRQLLMRHGITLPKRASR